MPKGNKGIPRIDLSNQVFGEWTVIAFDKIGSRGAVWKCKCSCGTERSISAATLKAQESTKCRSCAYKALNPHTLNKHIVHARSRAKKKGYEFNITLEYIDTLLKEQNNRCALSGVELTSTFYARDHFGTSASLDRIDSSKGYIIGNVQWIHKELNTMKMDSKQTDFINWCKLVAEKNK